MANTANEIITQTYEKIAADTDTALAVTVSELDAVVEIALTTADSAPAATSVGHFLSYGDIAIREVLGDGFVWARVSPGSRLLSATLSVTGSSVVT